MKRRSGSQRQREVLEVLERHDRPLTAYEILDRMQTGEQRLAPPTVYRALAALTEQGRAHRLESINAFVPCHGAHAGRPPILAICNDCGSVDEHTAPGILSRLSRLTETTGFHARRLVVEIHGLCRTCSTNH